MNSCSRTNQSVIEQREVGLDTLSFHHALKHVLRQDRTSSWSAKCATTSAFRRHERRTPAIWLWCHPPAHHQRRRSPSRASRISLKPTNANRSDASSRAFAAVVCQRMAPTIAGKMTPARDHDQHVHGEEIDRREPPRQLAAAIETGTRRRHVEFQPRRCSTSKQGIVSEKEALAKATNAQALEMNFKGIFLDEGRRILG